MKTFTGIHVISLWPPIRVVVILIVLIPALAACGPPDACFFQEPGAGPGPTGHTILEIYNDIRSDFGQCNTTSANVLDGGAYFSTIGATWGPTAATDAEVAAIDGALTAENIKCGVTIFGVTCTHLPGCVAKTGQAVCYDNDSEESCPVDGFPGQDDDNQKGCDPELGPSHGANFGGYNRKSFPCSPGFTDNGNGTATDD